MTYEEFLIEKQKASIRKGIIPKTLPKALKPFQVAAVRWALSRRRSALFAGTGLGKTIKQLTWADAVGRHEQGNVLVLTPLAVAHQTVQEAAKFDIKGVKYSQGKDIHPITITNYDRVESFDPDDFCAVVLDESSIIKHDDSKTRSTLIEMFSKTDWRLCCTATPSPNDYTEIGNHSEFLGVLTAAEMLAMYFVHEGAIRAGEAVDEWRLKRHAEQEFWKWVSTWALVYKHPKDLGFEEPDYDLSELRQHVIEVDFQRKRPSGMLFAANKMSLRERISVRKETTPLRVDAAAKLIASDSKSSWLVWCGRNDEADGLEKLLPDALQVSGSMERELKQERLLGFVKNKPRILITKPSIAGFGMNWQHCNKMVFLGLNDSFEQLYQAIRRCWRFGQKHPVDVYLVSSSAEGVVLNNVLEKEKQHERMYREISKLSESTLRSDNLETRNVYDHIEFKGEFPTWLR